MLGDLTSKQSEYILLSNHIGRIGCHADGRVLVIPVTYVFDENHIYGYSLEGMKIKMMRKNPEVCFQVDCIENMTNWRSVIAWGTFEELKTDILQRKAKKLFIERLSPLTLGDTVNPSREPAHPPVIVHKKKKPVIYRITIKEISGRYEK
jgi:nitroimidazol reductase NimA-like FMN-containing flavoprotein (pyridoxamine 5'-phosphate oxidase superfamily)